MEETTVGSNKDSSNGATLVASAILAVGIIFSGVYYTTHNGGAGLNQQNNPSGVAAQKPIIDASKLPDDDAVLGNPNAPVTIVEFSDFQCPYCGKFWKETYPQIKSQYIDTGKVKLVYRDFPLSIHEMAQTYAEASECAHEQGKFWEMHDRIFGDQQTGSTLITSDGLKKIAKEIGLKETQLNACLDTHKYTEEVKKDGSDGEVAGVTGTPTFFINGKIEVGALPFSALQKDIEAALK